MSIMKDFNAFRMISRGFRRFKSFGRILEESSGVLGYFECFSGCQGLSGAFRRLHVFQRASVEFKGRLMLFSKGFQCISMRCSGFHRHFGCFRGLQQNLSQVYGGPR